MLDRVAGWPFEDREYLGQAGREAMVEDEFHAASWSLFSKATAAFTDSTSTRYHSATLSSDRSALNALERTSVGTPSLITTGCPKLRAGSITTRRSLVGNHRAAWSSTNSRPFRKS